MEISDVGEGVAPRSIDYTNSEGVASHEIVTTPEDTKRILKTVIQNEDKQKPGTSYKIRDFLLRNSGGEIDSVQAFTNNSDLVDEYHPNSNEIKDYLKNPDNWVRERVVLHNEIINKKRKSGVDLSLALKDIEPTIYIVRGNIATGKTTALRNHPHFARIRNNLDGIISPDDYKVIFHREKVGDNKSVKDDQIHQESLFLAREIQDQIINFGENRTSLVIDKRFAWEEEITSIILLAMNTSRDIDITDIDCPLELSVIRVLS